MEVLKHGRKWNLDNGIMTCPCGCEYKWDKEDVIAYTDKKDYSKSKEYKIDDDGYFIKAIVTHNKGIVCPDCGLINKLEEIEKEEIRWWNVWGS